MRQIGYVFFTFASVMVASLFMFEPAEESEFPREIPWFEFQGAAKTAFTKENLKGSWTLAYFGYTSCPDLCPVTLNLAKEAKDVLSQSRPYIKNMEVVFVSVDPLRDSPEKSQKYAQFFSPSFRGVTASISQQKKILGALDSVANNDRVGTSLEYKVYHPTSLFLFSPDGQWAGTIEDPKSATQIVTELTDLVIGAKKTI